jgi:hypothetical protein
VKEIREAIYGRTVGRCNKSVHKPLCDHRAHGTTRDMPVTFGSVDHAEVSSTGLHTFNTELRV